MGIPGAVEIDRRLAFLKALQVVTNKIHATNNVDEIMLEMSPDICRLFECDRLTLYVVGEDRQSIVSKIKTGLNSFKDLRLPITEQSVAGYVATMQRRVNLRDVYDEGELRQYSAGMHFLKEVDRRTGYRSKQMLVAPIVDAGRHELLGVIQLINRLSDSPFPPEAEEGIDGLAQTLAVALTQRLKPRPFVQSKYDALVSDGVISAAELDLAQRSARRKGVDLEEVLIAEFQVRPAAIGDALSRFFGVPYEPFKTDRIKPMELLKNLKRDYVEANAWLPIEENSEGIVVLALDPERIRSSRIANNVFPKSRISYRVTTCVEFIKAIEQFFGALSDMGSVGEMLSGLDDEDAEAGGGGSDELSAAADNELVRLVNKIIVDAYQQGASDIHIEPRPGKEKTQIRFRKDGTLGVYIEIPASYRNALVARIKIMCDLDISEKRKPQDGKIKFKKFGPLDIELRVATIPSAGGVEDIVMRILAAGEPIPLEKLGVAARNLERLKETVSKPYGLFFVCGPTGSGKTTTLHSILHHINTPETKIWTAEDPVEITQKGLRQVQVNKKAGLDFATVMRAFLRADPDVIMVGEMRDKETVSIGIEASLTGHLVFATLHTNSAPESINRLLDMGMDPFNFADALLGILAQRLAKRLCSACKEAYEPTDEEVRQLLHEYCEELSAAERWRADPKAAADAVYEEWTQHFGKNGHFTLQRAKGCDVCGGSGYKGRIGLHELLIGTDALKKQIQEHARVAELVTTAVSEGMRTLKMDGIEKILAGITDIKQVRAVCIK
ncbi:GspE/PulE family protein [Propionivibrio dicarboxylicus]|uniref:Type II secretory pathway ATPase GspE/PulE or T4P pilus assembly pathway ATPase PilB n=1 Tax=Propionivibrio dicarboxylicus TaxID=83767 RepID=A0A1G8FN26_9RHOO|nr:GspE/PulE family protein [Propionivibrio dicarboxylicus]SDH83487.1 Type II secretory pathway ATPase GspE/PulE or T4P pilus assembly pathway ATPase PilB [Propionivibrio dicarboxylicus]